MTIATRFTYPPIPDRSWDWTAYIEGEEDGPTGYGSTEAEAVRSLAEKLAQALAEERVIRERLLDITKQLVACHDEPTCPALDVAREVIAKAEGKA